MTKLQRLKKIAGKAVSIVGQVCLVVGAGSTIGLMWLPGEPDVGVKVLATIWIAASVFFAVMADKFRKLVNEAAAREHQDGYLRGVVSMILAHRRLYEAGDSDYMQTVVTSANDGLVDWRDKWAVPMQEEFERLDNEH